VDVLARVRLHLAPLNDRGGPPTTCDLARRSSLDLFAAPVTCGDAVAAQKFVHRSSSRGGWARELNIAVFAPRAGLPKVYRATDASMHALRRQVWLGRRWPIERRNWLPRVVLHAACSLGYATIQVVALGAIGAPEFHP